MELVNLRQKMEVSILENGRMVKWMGLELIVIMMEPNMKEILRIVKKAVKDSILL